MDSSKKGSAEHEGIWETDFKIAYTDLNFEGEVAEGAFGKIYKGDYFGTPVAIKRCAPLPFPVPWSPCL
jgi:predicted Ser/Thr protein kinase